ncbi:protein-L-isoaspartate O-methyltransferase family protein [Serinicoccus kebangsaanensis]|uniref:protein-L-isoaspartate O-methyltransferase family protein n=1 Tax=Serinicoccus kebangsaanensis TaxID=2602069 RepID=UPI00124F4047|nr:methyltransferase domain-containing protein [Serinicoccus kebangsaanensis]
MLGLRHQGSRHRDRLVARAMSAVPRGDFLPPGVRHRASVDAPLAIGHGATSSQPSTVATMLSALDARAGHRVLDVGAGSGWTTALLAHLVGESGRVVGVELEPELVDAARDRLRAAGVGRADVVVARQDVLGWPDEGPYDRILVSAMADRWPRELVEQLADGGRMVLPHRGRLVVADRRGTEVRRREAPGWYRFVPLR